MPTPTSVVLVAAMLMAGTAVPAHAQKEDAHAAVWLAAAGRHQAGALDEPVLTVTKWSRKQVIETVTNALRQSSDTALLIKGLALHTDAAIFERASGEGRVPQLRAGSTVLLDGNAIGSTPRSLQWEVGRLIAGVLATRPASVGPGGAIPDGVGPARTWFHASSALLQQWADCGTLRRHLESGLQVFPNDATLLLDRATLHQTFADPRVQVWIRDAGAAAGRTARIPTASRVPRANEDDLLLSTDDGPAVTSASRSEIMQVGTPLQELALAERDLRRALAIEPALVEARIRLAHVLSAAGQSQEAAAQARTAVETPLAPFLEYYATMVLGRAEQEVGRHAEARTAFERAARRFPAAQSPRVALSRLAVADGRSVDAVAALIATSGPEARRDAGDPWWLYFRLHEPDGKALLMAFRTQAR